MEKSVLEKIQDPRVENHYNLTSTSAQYPAPQHGGRIPNIMDPKQFSLKTGMPYVDAPSMFGDTNRRDLVGHKHSETPLNTVFFSNSNIDSIQEAIIEQVYLLSGSRISRQSDHDLKIIMRSYYLSYATNNPARISDELEDLNRRVIAYASAKIYSEVDFHKFYLKDLQDFAPAIANPTNVHVFGTRTGELKSFF